MPEAQDYSLLRRTLTVFAPFALGYYLSYLFRSVNAIIAPDLISDIGLTAGDLGVLTAAYFLAFAAFQLPLGLLLDRYGPPQVQSLLLLCAAAGAAVFASGDHPATLIVGRAMIGFGVAGGLMASLKAITLWFPPHRWALVNGLFTAMGGLGALSATVPVQALLGITDWRGVFLGLSVATLLVSATIFLVVPRRLTTSRAPSLNEALKGLGQIYRDRLFWRLAPVGIATFAAGNSIQGLWSGPWLADVMGLSRPEVATHLLVQAAALTTGFILNGMAGDYFARRGVSLLTTMVVGLAVFMVALGLMVVQWIPSTYLVLALFGAFSNWTMLAYAILSRHFPEGYAGRATTALNLLVFLGAFAGQSVIGAIIGLWPAPVGGGYAPEAYRWAFGLMFGLLLLSWLWLLVPHARRRD